MPASENPPSSCPALVSLRDMVRVGGVDRPGEVLAPKGVANTDVRHAGIIRSSTKELDEHEKFESARNSWVQQDK